MAKCHQCAKNVDSDTRDGDCNTCFKKDVTFCATCAMWELGPKESETDILEIIATQDAPLRRSLRVSRQESSTSDSVVSSLAEVPLACEGFLKAMGKVSKLIENQLKTDLGARTPFTEAKPKRGEGESDSSYNPKLNSWREKQSKAVNTDIDARLYGENFGAYVCKVLDRFRARYPVCKYDRRAVQVLLVMYLSAQERVEDRYFQVDWNKKDEGGRSVRSDSLLVKRWHTRTLAGVMLDKHLDAIGTHLGSKVKDIVSQDSWRVALESDGFELYMKGLKSPTNFAIDLREKLGKSGTKAREALELCVLLYHVLTTTRAKDKLDDHWALKVEKNDFAPYSCLGVLSKAHYEAIYDNEGDFKTEVEDGLNAIHAALADVSEAGKLPSHPRYPDDEITRQTRLDQVEKDYFGYLPRMDTPQSKASERTECEQVVRKRVKEKIKPLRDAVLKGIHHNKVYVYFTEVDKAAPASTTRKINLEAKGVTKTGVSFGKKTGEDHVREDLDETAKAAVKTFADLLKAPQVLNPITYAIEVKVHRAKGNSRRTNRCQNVIDELKTHLQQDGQGYYHEYARNPEVVNEDGSAKDYDVDAYLDRVLDSMRNHFYVDQAVGDYPANLFMTTTDFLPRGWFPLMLRKHYYGEILPECGFPEDSDPHFMALEQHYEAWKSGESGRPAHYLDWRNHKDLWLYDCFEIDPMRRPVFGSLSTQPYVPEPNNNYGTNTILFDRAKTAARSIHNFGDKYNPRRSMLLLLDDIIFVKTRKDGSDPVPVGIQHKTIDDILERVERIPDLAELTLEEQFSQTVTDKWKKTYGVGDTLIECQIFGGVDMSTECLAFISVKGRFGKTTARNQLRNHYSGIFLEYPAARVKLDSKQCRYTVTTNDIQSELQTKAEDKTDT